MLAHRCRDMPNFDELLQQLPEGHARRCSTCSRWHTGTGFMNAELFTLMVPMVFIFYGVGRGARMVAGEEEVRLPGGRAGDPGLDPVACCCRRLLALADRHRGARGGALAVVLLACSLVFGLGIGRDRHARGLRGDGADRLRVRSRSPSPSGRRPGGAALALGIGGTAAVGAYVLYALGRIVDSVEPYQPLSPFQQALQHGPLGGSLPLTLCWVALGAALALAAAIPVFDRRDLRLH